MSLLAKLLDAEKVALPRDRRAAASYLGRLRRDPSDLGPLGEPYIVGMAVAMMRIPPSPGWIPYVQAEAMRLGAIAETL
jgi:hypothetical protein